MNSIQFQIGSPLDFTWGRSEVILAPPLHNGAIVHATNSIFIFSFSDFFLGRPVKTFPILKENGRACTYEAMKVAQKQVKIT